MQSTTSCNECLMSKCAYNVREHPTSIAMHAQRLHVCICMVQFLCLLQSLDAVSVGATRIIPVNEIQSSVVLRLQMVNVVCLGICSVGQYSHPTSHQQMKPVWQLIPTMTCMKQRQPLQHVKECLTGVPGLVAHTALHSVCVHRLCAAYSAVECCCTRNTNKGRGTKIQTNSLVSFDCCASNRTGFI